MAIIGQVLVALGRILPWLLRVAPWLLTALNVLLSFWPAAQRWVSDLAATGLNAVFGVDVMNMGDLPTYYYTQINTFVPLDLMVTSLAAFVPFYLACLVQRIARARVMGRG